MDRRPRLGRAVHRAVDDEIVALDFDTVEEAAAFKGSPGAHCLGLGGGLPGTRWHPEGEGAHRGEYQHRSACESDARLAVTRPDSVHRPTPAAERLFAGGVEPEACVHGPPRRAVRSSSLPLGNDREGGQVGIGYIEAAEPAATCLRRPAQLSRAAGNHDRHPRHPHGHDRNGDPARVSSCNQSRSPSPQECRAPGPSRALVGRRDLLDDGARGRQHGRELAGAGSGDSGDVRGCRVSA